MENLNTQKSKARRRFVVESLGLILLALSPFIYKIHVYFSDDPEATISILGYVIDNNGFPDISTYIWFLISKIIPIYLLAIWFFTCKHWWYHIILIPLCMYSFQLFEVIYSEDEFIETENVLWLLPICMVVIPFVYFIRIKLYDKYVHGIDLEAMEAELQYLKKKNGQPYNNTETPIQNEDLTNSGLSEMVPKRTLFKLIHEFRLTIKNLFSL